MLAFWKKSYGEPPQCVKKQRHHFADKGPYSQSYGFSRSHVWMWQLDHKEIWVLKNRSFWSVGLGKILRVPWTARRTKQSILKEINPECSLEGLRLRLKLQYSGHLMWRASSLEKILIMGRIESKKRRGQRMRWYQLNGHEFEQTPGDSGGQRSLVYYSPWDCKDSNRT